MFRIFSNLIKVNIFLLKLVFIDIVIISIALSIAIKFSYQFSRKSIKQ